MGCALPPRGAATSRFSRSTARCSCGASRPPSDLGPTAEYHPAAMAPAKRRRAPSHEVPTPTALPIRQGPPFPGFAFPGHVASLHLPCASTPYSLRGLPGVFPTRCALGAPPFRALPDRDRKRLSASHPLLRLAVPTAVGQTLGLLYPRTSPRLVCHEDTLIEQAN
jgi:hypothetical protein